MPLSDIVNVTITQDSRSVSRASFGTPLILGPNVNVNGRGEYFSDAASAIDKVIGASTLEEALITAAFAQNPAPTQILLGAVQASKTFVFTEGNPVPTAGSIKATVDGVLITQSIATTFDAAMTAIAATIEALANVLTATYTTGTNTLVVTPVTGKCVGITFDLTAITVGSATSALTCTELAETYADALGYLVLEFSDWYGVCAATRTYAKQVLVANWVESNKKFFIAGSANADIVNLTVAADTGGSISIAAYAKDNSLERTAVIYNSHAATQGIESAWFGQILPLDPGTYTAMFKTLAGITVDELTTTQTNNARAKYASIYQDLGGVSITRDGKVGANEYIDVVIFIDWLDARITEAIFAALVSLPKIPYTALGLAIVQGAVEQPLKIGQNRGGISPTSFDSAKKQNGGFYVTVPALEDIDTADKQARLLPDVEFTAFMAGAIHSVVVNGVVSL